MNRLISLLHVILFSIPNSFCQETDRKENLLGAYFSPGITNKGTQVFTTGLRYMNAPHKMFAYGLEANYIQYLGTYRNSDAFGGIGFVRLTPFDNAIFAEVGMQVSKNYIHPYASFGLRAKINNRFNAELQARPFTFSNDGANLSAGGDGGFLRKIFFGLTFAID